MNCQKLLIGCFPALADDYAAVDEACSTQMLEGRTGSGRLLDVWPGRRVRLDPIVGHHQETTHSDRYWVCGDEV